MTQMSLATAAKRESGPAPAPLTQYLFLCQEGVSAPDPDRGLEWVQLCFSVEMPCRAASGLGVGCREPEALRSLSSEMMGTAVQSLPADFLFLFGWGGCGFLKIVLKSGRNMKDFMLMGV